METSVSNGYTNFNNSNKNENATCISNINSNVASSKSEDNSMAQINECFEALKIESCVESDEGKCEQLVGKINSVITSLHIAVVEPFSSDILLYVGTPLFLICRNIHNCKTRYTLLGYIDDIFGSVGKPLYSVATKCNPTDISSINTPVYYFPNHPNTMHMYIQDIVDKMSQKRKYNIKTEHAKI